MTLRNVRDNGTILVKEKAENRGCACTRKEKSR